MTRPFILLTIICASALLIFTGNIPGAGALLTAVLSISILRSLAFLNSSEDELVILLFVLSPFIGFLRQFIFSYNGISYILIASLFLYYLRRNDTGKILLDNKNVLFALTFFLGFVIYGTILGFPLSRFMKFIETALAILVFSIFLKNFNAFKKYSLFFIVSSIATVISLSGKIETRFIFEDSFSNEIKADPSLLGISLVLSALLLIVDQGQWIDKSISKNRLIRSVLIVITVFLLIITTSRIGMLTLLGGLVFWSIGNSVKLKRLLSLLIIFFFGILVVLISPFRLTVEEWYRKTFFNSKGLAGATTGRSNQWEMLTEYLSSSDLLTILLGYGPGNAPQFSEKYSVLVDSIDSMYGKAFELHSLYLNVLVEYGLLAFFFFILFIIYQFFNLRKTNLLYRSELPFVLLISYLIYIFSVSGLGLVPGLIISIILHRNVRINFN